MRSLEQQFAEIRSALLDKRLCVEADIKQFTTASTMEERLSGLKKYAAKHGIVTESVKPRIQRKNGSGSFTESDSNRVRIQRTMREMNVTAKEAAIFLGVPLTEATVEETTSLREAWKRYAPVLTESEIESLVKRQVPVPVR